MTRFNDLGRRQFVRLGMTSVFAGFGLKLTGCSTPVESSSSVLATKKVYDIQTHVRGSRGFTGSVLRASQIKAGQPVTLKLTEGANHSHDFVVSPAQLKELVAGQTVYIKTQRASGHDHDMEINPATRPQGAQSVDVEIDDGGTPPADGGTPPADGATPPADDTKVYAALGEGDAPNLYVAASEELAGAEYCVNEVATCNGNLGNREFWKVFKLAPQNGKQVLKSKEAMELINNGSINIRANTKADVSKVLNLVLKVTAK
jgi:hypothetical protein